MSMNKYLNPLLLWTHLDAQSPDAQDALGCTVPRCTGRTWTHYDKLKLRLCGNELALLNFKQNNHITHFDGAECEYEHGFPVGLVIFSQISCKFSLSKCIQVRAKQQGTFNLHGPCAKRILHHPAPKAVKS